MNKKSFFKIVGFEIILPVIVDFNALSIIVKLSMIWDVYFKQVQINQLIMAVIALIQRKGKNLSFRPHKSCAFKSMSHVVKYT